MPTSRETILAALHARLSALPATALRGEVLPERVPAESLLILRDGEPGEPEVTLSPLRYHYQHRAEVEAVVQSANRDGAFDTLCASIGAALVADRTLGGLCDWVEAEAPRPVDLPVEGAASLKAAVIPVVLHYSTADPLGCATQAIRKTDGGATVPENLNALADSTDMVEALNRLQAMAPAVESVSLVVAWFGDDLRAGSCKVRPGVEVSAKSTTPASWSVNGVSRASAFLVSRDAEDRPVYGGTPSDFAVVQAIREMKARGLRVTFYPFILMDVPPGNTLPNPYSDNAAETGQPAFPWRGRITCSPAAGFAGTVDKTAAAASQVAALFGAATPASFSVSGQSVSWTGPSGDWGLRRMVLHYAHLCAAAGGVDAFLIGTEMPGLTTIRSGASTYPAVQAYRNLLADVRSILGSGTRIGYRSPEHNRAVGGAAGQLDE